MRQDAHMLWCQEWDQLMVVKGSVLDMVYTFELQIFMVLTI